MKSSMITPRRFSCTNILLPTTTAAAVTFMSLFASPRGVSAQELFLEPGAFLEDFIDKFETADSPFTGGPLFMDDEPSESSSLPKVCHTVNFVFDDYGHKLLHGDNATNVMFPHGLTVTAKTGTKHANDISIYNTNVGGIHNTGANPELEVGVGNVLIVQQQPVNGSPEHEDVELPESNPAGGWIVLGWDCPVTVQHVEIIVTERFPFLDFYNGAGNLKERIRGPKTGEMTASTKFFNVHDVTKVEVYLRGSGGISKIRFCTPC